MSHFVYYSDSAACLEMFQTLEGASVLLKVNSKTVKLCIIDWCYHEHLVAQCKGWIFV